MSLISALLPFHPAIVILIASFFVLFLINLGYKFLINQDEAKRIKSRISDLRKKMDEYKEDKKKTTEIFSEVMKENSTLMRMTLKPMLLSALIVLLVIPFATEQFGDKFVEGGKGNVTIAGSVYQAEVSPDSVKVTGNENFECALPCRKSFAGGVWNIEKENSKTKFAMIVAFPPLSMPFFGDDIGWVGWYITVSIPLVLLLRKLLKIYV